jgi:hypothetical protein
VNNNGSDNGWLEPVLRDGLKRVSTPPELWYRVVLPRVDDAAPQPRTRFVWMLAVASAMTASILAIVWGYKPVHAGTMNANGRAEFKSSQISDVRSWIRKRTGVDLPLVINANAGISVKSASISEDGRIEVRYRAGDQDAVLLVTASLESRPEHRHVSQPALEQAATVSWSMGQRVYTLAVERAGGLRAACVACHAELTL